MTDGSDRFLVVMMGGRRVGELTMNSGGRFTLTYDETWRGSSRATPLSLSLPLSRRQHGDAAVRAFLWGLLPDNERVVERWARTYQVSASNPFALLRHVGEDCAGAAQFVAPQRLDALVAGDGGVRWLADDDVAERLSVLRRDPTAWHVHNSGQFSLAGAQAKTALHFDAATGRWGEPWGSVPTTHILKPAVIGLDDHDLNEHLCLRAASLMGLQAAPTRVATFGAERVILVGRYDRRRAADGTVGRIHQEDLCQALGVLPTAKYQNDGGPAPEQIVALLRDAGSLDRHNVDAFVLALAYNWIIGGTDAHAKNYSILLDGPIVRLAPLYDLASALVYDNLYQPKLRMAMRIGGEYRLTTIAGRHWQRFAEATGRDPDETAAQIDGLAVRAADAFATAAADEAVRELGSDLPGRLVDQVATRADRCRKALRS